MTKRMQFSGYDKKFRYEVITSALAAYRKMIEKDERGECPLYRPREWNRRERQREKGKKKKGWYKKGGYESVIFVPCTPKSELANKFKQTIKESNAKIKIIEKSGRTIGDMLRTSDPRKKKKCERVDCPVCTTGGKGNCKALDVNYKMTCECDDLYKGTTTRSGYIRGNEHLKELNEKSENSDIWRHCVENHDGHVKKFKIDIIETFRRDPLLRQVSEAMRICRTPADKIINRREEYTAVK